MPRSSERNFLNSFYKSFLLKGAIFIGKIKHKATIIIKFSAPKIYAKGRGPGGTPLATALSELASIANLTSTKII